MTPHLGGRYGLWMDSVLPQRGRGGTRSRKPALDPFYNRRKCSMSRSRKLTINSRIEMLLENQPDIFHCGKGVTVWHALPVFAECYKREVSIKHKCWWRF